MASSFENLIENEAGTLDQLALIIEKVTAPRISPGMTSDRARDVAKNLLWALRGKSICRDPMSVSLPPFLDQCWHDLILETSLWRRICTSSLFTVLEHSSLTADDPVDVKRARVEKLRMLCELVFGPESVADQECWRLEANKPETRKRKEPSATGTSKRTRRNAGDTIQLFIKSLTGKTLTLEISPSVTLLEAKKAATAQFGSLVPPVGMQRWVFAGRALNDEETLSGANIQKESTIHLVTLLRGC